MMKTRMGVIAMAAIATLTLAACGGGNGGETDPTTAAPTAEVTTSAAEEETTEAGAESDGNIEIEDNNGTHTITVPPKSVVSLDNRTFETLYDWGIELSAAPVSLMPPTVGYKDDASIPDIGNHREPNLELIVAAEPDLIINGQRFTGFFDDIAALTPDAVQINFDPRDGEPFDEELKRQITALGQIFGKESEAAELTGAFDDAIADAVAAYDPSQKVMAVNVSGGNIGYLAPAVGRTIGPIFDILGLTPALVIDEATDDHQGDDISVESIADSNPDWILVLDRDAAVSADDPSYVPANEVIEGSAALRNVTAVVEGNIIYMPADTYTNEGIQTYTEFFQALAEAFGGQA
ncbi:MAG TPA: ABC transporter substrate-binding protein [Actinomycetaceae bacterium]|nr:ABC transporter substrate-binding protein [Actinomycetaceae bacterium]